MSAAPFEFDDNTARPITIVSKSPGRITYRVNPSPVSLVKSNVVPADVVVSPLVGVTVRENEEKHGIEIVFPAKPCEEIRTALKAAGFRWSRFSRLWWKRDDGQIEAYRLKFAA